MWNEAKETESDRCLTCQTAPTNDGDGQSGSRHCKQHLLVEELYSAKQARMNERQKEEKDEQMKNFCCDRQSS